MLLAIVRCPPCSVPPVPLITHLRHPRVAVGPGTSLPQWEPSASGQQRGQQHQGARDPRSAGRWPHRVPSRLLCRSRGARERVRAPPRLLLGRERGLRRRLRPVARGPREERRERALGCAPPVSRGLRARSVAPMSLSPTHTPLPSPRGPSTLGDTSGLRGAAPLIWQSPRPQSPPLSPSRPQANSCPGEVAAPRCAPRAATAEGRGGCGATGALLDSAGDSHPN